MVWKTLSLLLGGIAYFSGVSDPAIIGSQFPLSALIAFVLSAVAVVVAVRHPRAYEFSNDVVSELNKVTWPERAETQRSTVVVIVTTLIISFLLGVFDFVWAELTGLIYS
ncbi:MAG: preprotein translocase subunit SecE [Myxococcales bacterium]|nr:preprotein translocase subunit SecE [Myxococcales bacterium]